MQTEIEQHFLDDPECDYARDFSESTIVAFFGLLAIACMLCSALWGVYRYTQPPVIVFGSHPGRPLLSFDGWTITGNNVIVDGYTRTTSSKCDQWPLTSCTPIATSADKTRASYQCWLGTVSAASGPTSWSGCLPLPDGTHGPNGNECYVPGTR